MRNTKRSENREPLSNTLMSILENRDAHQIAVTLDFAETIIARAINLPRQKKTVEEIISADEWERVLDKLGILLQNDELRAQFFNYPQMQETWQTFCKAFPHLTLKVVTA